MTSINNRMAPFIRAMKVESIFAHGCKRDSVRLMRSVSGAVRCLKQGVCLGTSYQGFARGFREYDYWPAPLHPARNRTEQDKTVTEFAVGIDYRHHIAHCVKGGGCSQQAVDLAHQIVQHIVPESLRPYTYVCEDFAILLVHEDLNGLSFAAAYQLLRIPNEKASLGADILKNILDALVYRRDVGLALYWLWLADGGHAPSKPGDGGVFMSTDEEYIIGKDNRHFPTKLRDNFFAGRDRLVDCGWGLYNFSRQKGITGSPGRAGLLEDTGKTNEYQSCARDYLRGKLTLAQFEECYDREVKRTQEFRDRAREALERARVQ